MILCEVITRLIGDGSSTSPWRGEVHDHFLHMHQKSAGPHQSPGILFGGLDPSVTFWTLLLADEDFAKLLADERHGPISVIWHEPCDLADIKAGIRAQELPPLTITTHAPRHLVPTDQEHGGWHQRLGNLGVSSAHRAVALDNAVSGRTRLQIVERLHTWHRSLPRLEAK